MLYVSFIYLNPLIFQVFYTIIIFFKKGVALLIYILYSNTRRLLHEEVKDICYFILKFKRGLKMFNLTTNTTSNIMNIAKPFATVKAVATLKCKKSKHNKIRLDIPFTDLVSQFI